MKKTPKKKGALMREARELCEELHADDTKMNNAVRLSAMLAGCRDEVRVGGGAVVSGACRRL